MMYGAHYKSHPHPPGALPRQTRYTAHGARCTVSRCTPRPAAGACTPLLYRSKTVKMHEIKANTPASPPRQRGYLTHGAQCTGSQCTLRLVKARRAGAGTAATAGRESRRERGAGCAGAAGGARVAAGACTWGWEQKQMYNPGTPIVTCK